MAVRLQPCGERRYAAHCYPLVVELTAVRLQPCGSGSATTAPSVSWAMRSSP